MDNRSGFEDIQNAYASMNIDKKPVIVESKTIEIKDFYSQHDELSSAYVSMCKPTTKMNEGVLGDIAKFAKGALKSFGKFLSNLFGAPKSGATPEAGQVGAIHGNGFKSETIFDEAEKLGVELTDKQKEIIEDYQKQYDTSIEEFIKKIVPLKNGLVKTIVDAKLKFPLLPTVIFNKYEALLNNAKTKEIFQRFCVDLSTMKLPDLNYTIKNIYEAVHECIQATPGVDGSNGKIFEDTSSVYHIMTSCLKAPFDVKKNTRMTAIVIFYLMSELFRQTYAVYNKVDMIQESTKIKKFFTFKDGVITSTTVDAKSGMHLLNTDNILNEFNKQSADKILTKEALKFVEAVIKNITTKQTLTPALNKIITVLNANGMLLNVDAAGAMSFGKTKLELNKLHKDILKNVKNLPLTYNLIIISYLVYDTIKVNVDSLKSINGTCEDSVSLYTDLDVDMVSVETEADETVEDETKDESVADLTTVDGIDDAISKLDVKIENDKKVIEDTQKEIETSKTNLAEIKVKIDAATGDEKTKLQDESNKLEADIKAKEASIVSNSEALKKNNEIKRILDLARENKKSDTPDVDGEKELADARKEFEDENSIKLQDYVDSELATPKDETKDVEAPKNETDGVKLLTTFSIDKIKELFDKRTKQLEDVSTFDAYTKGAYKKWYDVELDMLDYVKNVISSINSNDISKANTYIEEFNRGYEPDFNGYLKLRDEETGKLPKEEPKTQTKTEVKLDTIKDVDDNITTLNKSIETNKQALKDSTDKRDELNKELEKLKTDITNSTAEDKTAIEDRMSVMKKELLASVSSITMNNKSIKEEEDVIKVLQIKKAELEAKNAKKPDEAKKKEEEVKTAEVEFEKENDKTVDAVVADASKEIVKAKEAKPKENVSPIKQLADNAVNQQVKKIETKISNVDSMTEEQKAAETARIEKDNRLKIFESMPGVSKGDPIALSVVYYFEIMYTKRKDKVVVDKFKQFDRELYDYIGNDDKAITEIRNKLEPVINEILAPNWAIGWPDIGSQYDENIHLPENDSGNTIKSIKSAMIFNSVGRVVNKSLVTTGN